MPNRSRKRDRSRSRSEDRSVLHWLKRMDKRIKLLENTTRKRKNEISSSSDSGSASGDEREHRSSEDENTDGETAMNAQGLVRDNPNEEVAILPVEAETPNDSLKPLDRDMLAILGEEVKQKIVLGDPIQPEIAVRWSHIVRSGLDESVRQQLIEKYPSPENGTLLAPPQLNLMIKQAVHESVQRRDERLAKIQLQLAAGLSAVGQTITRILGKQGGSEEGVREHIEALNDAGRLIVDVIHSESLSRRELVAYDLNKEWKKTLVESPLDNWLFGENLEGRLKTEKELQASTRQLKLGKTTPRQNTPRMSRAQSLPHLNYRSLPRYQQGAKQGRHSVRDAPLNQQRQGRPLTRSHSFATKTQDKERTNRRFRRQ